MTLSAPRTERSAALPATAVFAGTLVSLVGLTWDVEWHSDVGPDTFFTLPHLFLYSGSAIAGLTSLAAVLHTTAEQRRGRPADPRRGGPGVRVLGGAFLAPVGYLLAGCGAASFLLYGLWDLWWHTLYGFDAVIDSPPHIGLLLSIMVTSVGAATVFAAARDTRWGTVGLVSAVAVLVAFGSVTILGLSGLGQLAVAVGTAFLVTVLLLVARRALDRSGAALGVAAAVVAWQAFSWWFSPWAARWYAVEVGLPLRDDADPLPEMPTLIPFALLLVAAAVELVWRWERDDRHRGVVAGAAGGLLAGAASPLQDALVYGTALPAPGSHAATAVAAALAGAVAGLLAVRLGTMLRQVGDAR